MTTRRTFIKGIGAGLLLPTTWDLFANHLANHGEPLMRVPKRIDHILYATCWAEDFQLSLDAIEDDLPSVQMPIKDFIASKVNPLMSVPPIDTKILGTELVFFRFEI